MIGCPPVRRIGIVTVARSDKGHLSPLIVALGAQAIVAQWPDITPVLSTDLVVIFGDRWEMAAAAAHVAGQCIPIVHLHAGETTEAVIDDACRWAISEMATYRITAHDKYLYRLYDHGFAGVNLGAPGLARLPIKTDLGRWNLLRPVILVQFHPETRNLEDIPHQVTELKAALDDWLADIVITEPGMDVGREHILEAFAGQFHSFTDDEWLAMLARANVLVGNSSCGIIETPSIPLASINIGNRQQGRLMASSVIQAPHERDAIRAAINTALGPEWRATHLTGENPYGDRGAATRIAEFLRTCALSS